MPDEVELHGLFYPEADVSALRTRLVQIGVPEEHIHVMSSLPLSERSLSRVGGIPMYVITIVAGLVGIAVGVFFSAGTAAMYPLMTGGKPIVAPPVVGIISYETMMLVAIVTTFLVTIVTIRNANAGVRSHDPSIEEGRIGVVVRVPMFGSLAGTVRDALDEAGALDVRLSVLSHGGNESRRAARQAASLFLPIAGGALLFQLAACSRDMQEQPSYQAQENPRRHSPPGSVPVHSRTVLSTPSDSSAPDAGAQLFQINCIHCHGVNGTGDGPVAAFLKERPANLKSKEVRTMSEPHVYRVLTDGKDMMPSFRGELSADERRELARFVVSLSRSTEVSSEKPHP